MHRIDSSTPTAGLQSRCSECGFAREDTLRTRPGCLSVWRIVPVMVMCALLLAEFWNARSEATSNRTFPTFPSIVEDPPVTRSAIQSIAAGEADAEITEDFTRALRNAIHNGLPNQHHRDLPEPRASFVSAGFVAPRTDLKEWFGIGWPLDYVWGVRTLHVDDSVAAAGASNANPRASTHGAPDRDDLPFIWFPPWPGKGGEFRMGRWNAFMYETREGKWQVDSGELRFTAALAKSSGFPPQIRQPDPRVVVLKLAVLSIPIAALWCAWIIAGLIFRGWRRMLLLLACVAVIAAVFACTSSSRRTQTRGWSMTTPGAKEVWKDLASLDLHTADVLAMIERTDGVRELANVVLARAPHEPTDGVQYLALTIGPTWCRDQWRWSTNEPNALLRITTVDDSAYIPDATLSMPRPSGLAFALRHDDLRVTYRQPTRATRNVIADIHLGWATWIGLLIALAWSVPAAIVSALRRRRGRRRALRGLCVHCAHPLVPY